MFRVGQCQTVLVDSAGVLQHFRVQKLEIAAEFVGQPLADLHVIHVGDLHASRVSSQRSVEVVLPLHRFDRIQHRDVGDEAVVVAQQHVQPRQESVEFVQSLVVQPVSVGQLGLERNVPVVEPYRVRDQHVDPL